MSKNKKAGGDGGGTQQDGEASATGAQSAVMAVATPQQVLVRALPSPMHSNRSSIDELRQQLELARTGYSTLQSQNAALSEENAHLREKLSRLEQRQQPGATARFALIEKEKQQALFEQAKAACVRGDVASAMQLLTVANQRSQLAAQATEEMEQQLAQMRAQMSEQIREQVQHSSAAPPSAASASAFERRRGGSGTR